MSILFLSALKLHVKYWIFISTFPTGWKSSVLSGSITLKTIPFPTWFQTPMNLWNMHLSYDLWDICIIFLLFFYRSRQYLIGRVERLYVFKQFTWYSASLAPLTLEGICNKAMFLFFRLFLQVFSCFYFFIELFFLWPPSHFFSQRLEGDIRRKDFKWRGNLRLKDPGYMQNLQFLAK